MAIKTFIFDNTILTSEKKSTYLASDVASAGISLTVQSIVGMSGTGHILLIGEIGQEKTEIIQSSNGTAPTGTTVALQTACSFDHPQDTKIYILDYDQFAISRSTGISSQKSTLTTAGLQVDQLNSIYNDSTNTTGYGFVEFKNSISGAFSSASDPIPYAGYADNSVYMIKKRALDSVGEKIDTELITDEFLNECLAEARREYHNAHGKRPYRRKFNTDIGNVTTGMYRVAIPTDAEKPHTAENIYGVRIGPNENLAYYDKKDWDADYDGVAHSTLLDTYTASTSQDLWLDNVRDFDDSGSVDIGEDTIGYSAKGISGGTLRISSHGSNNYSSGADVWQGVSMGLPRNFTAFADLDGTSYIYFSCPLSTIYASQNIWADYYINKSVADSDSDELTEPDNIQDGYVHFIAWKIKKRKDKGLSSIKDDDYLKWEMIKQQALANEYLGQNIRITPSIDHLVIPF